MVEFKSIFRVEFKNFLSMRESYLGVSAFKHDVCYLASFDDYLSGICLSDKRISETTVNGWVKALTGVTRA
jgi:hypothetical protein